jgi:flavodoxin I
MWVYVVIASPCGVTDSIARAVARAVDWSYEHNARPADSVDPTEIRTPAIVFLGGPTHRREMGESLRTFLDRMPDRVLTQCHFAAFDTRFHDSPIVTGSSARHIQRAIEARGGQNLVPGESFFVVRRDGPLRAGEVERARVWASGVIAAAVRELHDIEVRPGTLSTTAPPSWEEMLVAVPS